MKSFKQFFSESVNEEVEQIDEISTELKKRYVEKGAEDVVDRFTGRGKYEKPRNPANFTKTGRPKKSVLNSPAAVKYREKLANRRAIVNKVSQEVHGKKRFSEEIEVTEAKKTKPGHNAAVLAKNISKVLGSVKKEEVEITEASHLRITKVYNKFPKKATYAVHTPDRKYYKEFDSEDAAKKHLESKK